MNVELRFGALSPSIGHQLKFQGATAEENDLERWQSYADAITLLSLKHLLSDSETHKARTKLVKVILKGARPSEHQRRQKTASR